MNLSAFSIRTILCSIIALMGLFAFILAMFSGSINEELIFNNQRAMVTEMIRVMTHEQLNHLSDDSKDLGLSLQSNPEFKQAIKAGDKALLLKMLNNQFHQYFVTAGIIKLEQLALFDADFKLLVEATEGSVSFKQQQQICPQLFDIAKKRTGSQRMVILQGLCKYQIRPIHTVVVPVGGLKIQGYIMVMTDFTHNLERIESSLSIPLTFRLPNNDAVYMSPNWPSKEGDSLISHYELKTSTGLPLLSIFASQNIIELTHSLKQSYIHVLIISCAGTLFIILLSLVTLHKTMLKPLNQLVNKFRSLRAKHDRMGEQLELTGTKEIHEIMGGFNELSTKLNSLYQSLEHMAYTDSLTKLPNRHQFQESLASNIQVHQQINRTFTLLLMDLNRFKEVNDTYGHNVGDELLKEVSLRLHNTLRDDDIVTQLSADSFSKLNENIVARLGGDEFSAILTDIHTAADAKVVAEKIVLAMKKPACVGGHELNIGLSIGIALYPKDAGNAHDLVSHADKAMYKAKKMDCNYFIYESE